MRDRCKQSRRGTHKGGREEPETRGEMSTNKHNTEREIHTHTLPNSNMNTHTHTHREREIHTHTLLNSNMNTHTHTQDRKSTRLNSSHTVISYVALCVT